MQICLRTLQYVVKHYNDVVSPGKFRKRLLLHLALLLAVAVDLPMFIGFSVDNEYTLYTYSFHRFESMLLFVALSITISNWAGLLYDIQEYQLYPFLIRKATLISINVVNICITLANFILCYFYNDFEEYTTSVEYIIEIFFQIVMSMLLIVFMLSAGIKLSLRIHGAAGLSDTSVHRQHRPQQRGLENQQLGSFISDNSPQPTANRFEMQVAEFRNALFNLNVVMGTCCLCITMQVPHQH